jgi:hypothetical protein
MWLAKKPTGFVGNRRDLSVVVFPQTILQVEHNVLAISLVKGKRVSMVGKKADWICLKPTGLDDLGVSPTLLEVEHNGL